MQQIQLLLRRLLKPRHSVTRRVAATSLSLALPSGRAVEAVITARRGAKRMTLRVDPIARRVLINGPWRLSQRDALGFIQDNASWIEKRFEALPSAAPFHEGASILFRGRPTLLKRKDGRGAPVYHDGPEPVLEICGSQARFDRSVRLALKAFAHSDALTYCAPLAERLGKEPSGLVLRDTRSRWGSCNSAGQIMLSWRLIGAPPRVFEYVVAHELAHLRELNHSPRFWAHVEALMPDWKPARAWLKTHGARLHALGR
jgi:predicted metal-dependent hydrolase